MRRYHKWLSVGLLALTPGMAMAGPLSFMKKENQSPPPATSRKSTATNQEMAYKVRDALKSAKLTGYEIDVEFQSGVVRLSGMVSSPDQKLAATRAASSIKGVQRVDNRLTIAEPGSKGAIQQAGGPSAASRGRVRQAQYQQGYEGQAPAQYPAEGSALQPEPMPQGAPQMGPAPAYGPMTSASHTIYNQPNLPNQAWPSYAQYPNYAAVTYPSQYAASAWPYIGPFYPYPQVPLGWRKATLEWDDGYWQLCFSPRTDRWWWFVDPRNW